MKMGFKKTNQRFREVILRGLQLGYERVQPTFSECDYKRRPGSYKRPKK
jgi:hypothetical protein